MEVNPTSPLRPFGKARLYLVAIGLLLALFFAGREILVQKITFSVDGKVVNVISLGGTVAEALEKAKLTVAKEDRIKPALNSQVEDGMRVEIVRAVPINVKVDGKDISFKTAALNVAEALKEQSIVVAPEDLVEPMPTNKLKAGMKVAITRALPLTIQVDGKEMPVKSPQQTVAQVLNEAKVTLGPLDKVLPSLTTSAANNLKIKVIRVAQKEEQVEQPVPYETVRRKDRSMALGINKVIQEGKNGLARLRYKIIMEDGRPVKKELLGRSILNPSVSKIIAMGTLQTVSRGGTDFKYSEAMNMKTSAYTHTGHRTASGTYPSHGVVAVDPKVIPMGSKLYIEGYGYATALDKGSDIKGARLDLFFETRREALNWGLRTKKVYILD